MAREHLVAVNIPADGLFLAILNKANGDFSRENCARLLCGFLRRFLEEKPDIIFLNVNYRRALTPSDVMDSYLWDITPDGKRPSPTTEGVSKYFSAFFTCARPLMEKGIDIYEIATEYIRAAGCRVYLSVRMNDGHYRDNPAINSRFAFDNSINGDGADLDYTRPQVQDLFCAYIQELLTRYAPDGIELDWLRYPTVLPTEKRGDYTIINNYMRRVRGLLPPELGLAVRLYPDEEKNLSHGFDVAQWIADGSVDLFTMENFYVPTNFEMPVADWRASIASRNGGDRKYTLLCGSDWGVCCQAGQHIPMNAALVRGYASACLHRGADGLYLFNFFEEADDSAWELTAEGTLTNCFSSRLTAAREPFLLPRRHIHIGATTRRYPIVLGAGEGYTFEYENPSGNGRLVLGCDAAGLAACANGEKLTLRAEKVFPGYEYPPKTRGDFVYAVTQLCPRVLTAPLPQGERLQITVENPTAEQVKILWLELSFEE